MEGGRGDISEGDVGSVKGDTGGGMPPADGGNAGEDGGKQGEKEGKGGVRGWSWGDNHRGLLGEEQSDMGGEGREGV